jgi:hypothetical protein
MPVRTRSMKKTVTDEDLEIAEILCQLKYDYRTTRDEDEESEYVPSDDDEPEEKTYTSRRTVRTTRDEDEESEYVPSDDEEDEEPEEKTHASYRTVRTTRDEDEESEYVPSDDEEDEEPEEKTYASHRTVRTTRDEDEESEYVPSDEDEDEFTLDPEDYAEDVIRQGCSDLSRGAPLDREFFRVCKRVMRGDYDARFTRWALQIQPVRSVGSC